MSVPHPQVKLLQLGPPESRRRRGCKCSARTRRRHNQINVTRLAKLLPLRNVDNRGCCEWDWGWRTSVSIGWLKVRKWRTCNAQPACSCFGPLCASHRLSVLLPDHYICPPPSSCSDCLSPLSSLGPPPLAHLGEIRPHQCVIRCETRDANGDMLSSYIGRGSGDTATVDGRGDRGREGGRR